MTALTADIAASPVVAPRARSRVPALDALRSLAILAMIVDHATLFVFAVAQLGWNGRAVGRIAEPIFVVLSGYLLAGRPRRAVLRRLGHLALAELLVAPLFFGVTQSLDILAGLIPGLGLYLLLGERLVWALPVFLLAPLDPLAPWFGYGIPLVVSQLALGLLLRRRHGWLGAALFLAAPLVMPLESAVPHLVSIGAVGLVLAAARARTAFQHPAFGLLGRRPLTVYVAHLYLVALIGFGAGRAGLTFPLVERAIGVTYGLVTPRPAVRAHPAPRGARVPVAPRRNP